MKYEREIEEFENDLAGRCEASSETIRAAIALMRREQKVRELLEAAARGQAVCEAFSSRSFSLGEIRATGELLKRAAQAVRDSEPKP